MAFQKIKTTTLHEWTQEEIIENRLIAGDDGIVNEVEVLIQPYIHTQMDVIIYQDMDVKTNSSNFKAELILSAEMGQKGDPITLTSGFNRAVSIAINDNFPNVHQDTERFGQVKIELAAGESKSKVVYFIDWDKNYYEYSNTFNKLYHNIDGTINYLEKDQDNLYKRAAPFYVNGNYGYNFTCLTSEQEADYSFGDNYKVEFEPLKNNLAIVPIVAENFTDEEDPRFTYDMSYGKAYYVRKNDAYPDDERYNTYYLNSLYTAELQAALSFDGITPDIPYRDINYNEKSYIFNLTETERELLRTKAQGSNHVPIYYLIRIVYMVTENKYGDSQYQEFVSATERTLTIVGAVPTLNPTVRDISPEALALTGNENVFIRYVSTAEFSTGATASKHATIVNQTVQCGSKVVSNLYNGIIDDVETANFIFNATDSRGLHADQVVVGKTLIEYVKPTCKQNLSIELSGETDAIITLKVSGNCFNGSFGLADNELLLEVRYTQPDGKVGNWMPLTGTPTFDGNTYELTATFTGFSYDKAYAFQCRATDKIHFVETSQYTIGLLPLFDWSEEDFNFNVPINVNADTLGMRGNTVLRHSATTNNTVLSANGGHIYIRPQGTNDTDGETIIYPDGSVSFGGAVNINGNPVGDHVIESGETSMGSNGTWHWAKWASGKAECHGCRNFGNMAVNTAWGSLYRGAVLSQALPEDLFNTTPDVINIDIVHSNFGGWIAKHETDPPSAITTGSFIFVRPAAATVTPTNIGFNIIGTWK